MTRFPILPSAPPQTRAEPPVDLLMQALQTVLPTGILDLVLDRIEAAR
jgi:hypothetical protein